MADARAQQQGLRLVLHLYRHIRRLHAQRLPPQLRELGNVHAASEFRVGVLGHCMHRVGALLHAGLHAAPARTGLCAGTQQRCSHACTTASTQLRGTVRARAGPPQAEHHGRAVGRVLHGVGRVPGHAGRAY